MKLKSPLINMLIIIGSIFTLFIIINFIFLPLDKPSSNSVIKRFKKNDNLFEKVVMELTNVKENSIYIRKHGSIISISTYKNYNSPRTEVENALFYKYEKAISLMEKLHIDNVYKQGGNISFVMTNFGQIISKISDSEKFKVDNHVIAIKNIKDGWHYIEINT